MTDLDLLLRLTSRTFALSIPELPEPTRRAIALAYLLFRVADTFEDATTWPRRERVEALQAFSSLLMNPTPEGLDRLVARLNAAPPCEHQGYLQLLRELPGVLDCLAALDEGTRAILVFHLVRTADGMAGYVERGEADGSLRLRDVDDLRNYCYVVAGIVGELICDVFIHHQPGLESVGEILRGNAVAFGEGLQLVNILRDATDDARDGRVYLPPKCERAQVFGIARDDLRRAGVYVRALQQAKAPRGYVTFCALPVLLAFATLDRVEKEGAGAKVSRAEVAGIVARLNVALATGQPAVAP